MFCFSLKIYILAGMNSHHNGLRTWIEIDRKKIAHNYRVFRSLISKKVKLMAVVKSNAYGHSLVDFSKEITRLGADWLGVDSIVEAVALRREGIVIPILVLGYTLPERMRDAVDHDISLSVSSIESFQSALKQNLPGALKIHIKADTGMHRQGFLLKEIPKVISLIKKHKNRVEVEGLFTHFAAPKNPALPAYTKFQIDQFEEWRKTFKKEGLLVLSHAAATAGTMFFLESHYDMVRIGIGLYGFWPSKEAASFMSGRMKLMPAFSWKTIISELKKLPTGSKIGYDCAETLGTDSVVAVCPVGYWHSYPRSLSSIGQVLIKGGRARVLGRVSMDMITIDVSSIHSPKPGDEVVLIGTSGKNEISAYEFAELSDTYWYEAVTRINPLIRRIYI